MGRRGEQVARFNMTRMLFQIYGTKIDRNINKDSIGLISIKTQRVRMIYATMSSVFLNGIKRPSKR
jgi:hypothetical protein